MGDEFIRTQMIIENIGDLKTKKVAVFGLGGVGSYVVEALARCGVGEFLLVDNDTIAESNINRQLYALHSTIGKFKADVAKERTLDINPNAIVNIKKEFYSQENQIDINGYDYVVDAIDTVSAKLLLIENCKKNDVPIISSMGTGNKLKQTFKVADIKNTNVCPLARVMRLELKRRNIKDVKVVYSEETPQQPTQLEQAKNRRQTPGSVAFVPSVAGLTIAREIVFDLLKK